LSGDLPNVFAQFDGARTVPAVLSVTARGLVDSLDAAACTISRAIGDLLVDLVDYSPGGPVQIGHGYLISDYPATREVLEELQPRAVSVADGSSDEREVGLLRQLGFDALLMLALTRDGSAWGLVEVYDRNRERFDGVDVAVAQQVVERASAALVRLGD
jgi:hypothetical protein